MKASQWRERKKRDGCSADATTLRMMTMTMKARRPPVTWAGQGSQGACAGGQGTSGGRAGRALSCRGGRC